MLVAVADVRSPLQPDTLSRALLSYTGAYRLDGAELVTIADAASRRDMVTEQVRDVRFEGSTRMMVTPKRGLPVAAAGLTYV